MTSKQRKRLTPGRHRPSKQDKHKHKAQQLRKKTPLQTPQQRVNDIENLSSDDVPPVEKVCESQKLKSMPHSKPWLYTMLYGLPADLIIWWFGDKKDTKKLFKNIMYGSIAAVSIAAIVCASVLIPNSNPQKGNTIFIGASTLLTLFLMEYWGQSKHYTIERRDANANSKGDKTIEVPQTTGQIEVTAQTTYAKHGFPVVYNTISKFVGINLISGFLASTSNRHTNSSILFGGNLFCRITLSGLFDYLSYYNKCKVLDKNSEMGVEDVKKAKNKAHRDLITGVITSSLIFVSVFSFFQFVTPEMVKDLTGLSQEPFFAIASSAIILSCVLIGRMISNTKKVKEFTGDDEDKSITKISSKEWKQMLGSVIIGTMQCYMEMHIANHFTNISPILAVPALIITRLITLVIERVAVIVYETLLDKPLNCCKEKGLLNT